MKRERSEYSKQYREKNKEKLKLYYKIRYERDKELIAVKGKEYREKNAVVIKERTNKSLERKLERALFRSAFNRARDKEIEFNLTTEDIIIPEYCPYLKVKITRHRGRGKIWTNPSIDRIDNSKGYTKGNIEIISNMANHMKVHASREQLITFAKSILEKFD